MKRAIGIIRVSEVKGREGDSFVSPTDQRDRIESVCQRDGLTLIETHEEMDVSGGKPLDQRPGLSKAVAAIEAGEADVIAAAYFDRLFRSLTTQAEVLERVERAGGQVLAVDVGQVSSASAGQWISSTMLGVVSEYLRRSIKERSGEGQRRAVARGAVLWARVPLGYSRRDDGTLVVNDREADLVRRAFEMRLEGLSAMRIRAWLKEQGVERSHRGVQQMLGSRVYLGEIHFGDLVNDRAHDPIIERDVFERVQRMVIPRGPRPQSMRLLSRLGVLRCGSCGSRMSAMRLPRQNDYPIYRCPSTSDCPRHLTISAEIVEDFVTSTVRSALQAAQGRASAARGAQEARRAAEIANEAYESALRVFSLSGAENESAAVERLTQLREARDTAEANAAQIEPKSDIIVTPEHWDLLSLDGRREVICAVVKRVVVNPGRGVERLLIETFI